MPEGYDYLFKLLLIGDSGVGKVRLSISIHGIVVSTREDVADTAFV